MKLSTIFSVAFLGLLAQSAVLPEDAPEVDIVADAQRSVLQAMGGELGGDELSKRNFGISFDLGFSINILSLQNSMRSSHGCPLLNWDQNCYTAAKQVVSKYDCSSNSQTSGSSSSGNWGTGSSNPFSPIIDCGNVVNSWYNKGKKYNYGATCPLNAFTNLIWKSTSKVGCAYKDCRSHGNGYYYYCNYSPSVSNPSNSQKTSNVAPPKSPCTVCATSH
ncbi:uncharacterized protein SPAPADRAFT_52858 [Spathaspora passalidarum NRRL Y-27907]|uniref:SCP domain-containing protein n=1 Tax=Spathaspora passalidarum (strain NRRL Y-27907 / 11-Y1) TaxID=619300 RepID=G3AVW9_SPAPN|nr:uncharacterized protein SPAPADRAFT_52858 [Spathaspora passalidarum NRRL Y-27907]EGW30014.1 hypothetical protein SPAPADRAFT_52858 [Spathaspora passalidarum NRRL Y-27907]